MKKLWFIAVPFVAVIGWLAWRAPNAPPDPVKAELPVTWQGAPPTLTITDAEGIFKKAFWRSPVAGDEILHAVRHEWSDAGGLLRWQWFLVVKASPELLRYLREDNAFGLVAGRAEAPESGSPAWFRFKPEEVTQLQAPQSSMRLIFSNSGPTLFATAAGRGFTRGASEPPPPVQSAPAPGRLPSTPPPSSP